MLSSAIFISYVEHKNAIADSIRKTLKDKILSLINNSLALTSEQNYNDFVVSMTSER